MASWNVRTLQDNDNNPERRTAVISKVLDKYSVDIAALSETRFPGDGELKEKHYTFFWIGQPESDTRSAGVGFAIKNSIVSELQQKPVGVNERLMTLRIPLSKTKYATFISAYAPTMTNTDEVKDKFYEELRGILHKVPLHDNVFLLRVLEVTVPPGPKCLASICLVNLTLTAYSFYHCALSLDFL